MIVKYLLIESVPIIFPNTLIYLKEKDIHLEEEGYI